MKKTLCIYHANCPDGFGAAWVVRKALGERNVEFIPASYGEEPPAVEGRDVLIVDFSYKRDVMISLANQANSITVLDHHKTAERELMPLLGNEIIEGRFSKDNSGAMMAWLHFFPNEEPPFLLKAIEDRDLWRFKLDCTKEYMATVLSHPMDFDAWDMLMNTTKYKLLTEGTGIRRHYQKALNDQILQNAYRMEIAGHIVPVLNTPYMYASEAGNIMSIEQPFAATYFFKDGIYKFSLRSQKEGGADVSKIAELFGGGGHQNAAGFQVTTDQFPHINNPKGLQR